MRDKVRNKDILVKKDVAPIEEKIQDNVYDALVMSDVHLRVLMLSKWSLSTKSKLKELSNDRRKNRWR